MRCPRARRANGPSRSCIAIPWPSATRRTRPLRSTTLYKLLQQQRTPDYLFALAELSFLYAQEHQQRQYYLAAAAFAYAFLLPEDEKSPVHPSDPRGRLAVDFYNQGLAEALGCGRRG